MRVLILTPVFPPARGGIETLAGQLARRLDGEIRVVTLASETTDAPPAQSQPTLRVDRVRNAPRGGRRSILRLNARAILAGLRFRPDVILVLHVKLAPAASVLSRFRGVPVAQYVHAKEILDVPEVARLAMRSAAVVIAVSQYSSELALGAGAASEQIRVVHNGIDLPERATGKRSQNPTLITVSRLEDRYKGHDVFLEAMSVVRDAIPDVEWLVVGEGALRPELEARAKQLGIDDRVRFLGAVDDAERDRLLDTAWAFVMLSRQPENGAGEGFGIAYVEAAAHGLPALAGRVPGVVDAVRDNVTGLLIDPTDVQAVAKAAVALLSDEALARRLGSAGLARAQELQWAEVVRRVQDVMDATIKAPRPRRGGTRTGLRWVLELTVGRRGA